MPLNHFKKAIEVENLFWHEIGTGSLTGIDNSKNFKNDDYIKRCTGKTAYQKTRQ